MPPSLELSGGTIAREQVSLWRDSWRRFRRNRLALIAAVYLFVLGVIAIVGIFWTPVLDVAGGAC